MPSRNDIQCTSARARALARTHPPHPMRMHTSANFRTRARACARAGQMREAKKVNDVVAAMIRAWEPGPADGTAGGADPNRLGAAAEPLRRSGASSNGRADSDTAHAAYPFFFLAA